MGGVIALTDTALKAVKPNRNRTSLATTVWPVRRSVLHGGIVWRFRYRLNGRQEKLTLGKCPSLTLKNARLKRDKVAQLVTLGRQRS